MKCPKHITDAQLAALERFIEKNGVQWKTVLRRIWAAGTYAKRGIGVDDAAALQQLRNSASSTLMIKMTTERVAKWVAERRYRSAAEILMHREGELEIDQVTQVNLCREDEEEPGFTGAYVQAWVYLSADDLATAREKAELEAKKFGRALPAL